MNHPKHAHLKSGERHKDPDVHRPYWKRAHHDWKFWVAVFLMLLGMGVYIVTLDLSVQPNLQNQKPSPTTTP